MENFTLNPYQFQDYSAKISDILIKHFGYEKPSFIRSERYNESGRRDLSKKSEVLFLSNGDSFRYTIPKASLAHLFGIDTDYLISNGYVNATRSYDALIELIEDPLRIKNKFGVEDYSKFVSPFVDKKLQSIISNIDIRSDSCEFFCKFDKNKTLNDVDEDVSYYVVSKDLNSDNYNVLILVEGKSNGDQKNYIPRSNLTFDSKDEVVEYLSEKIYYQELAILVNVLVKDDLGAPQRTFGINSYRAAKLDNLKDWADKLSATPNVLSDYIYAVGLLNRNKNTKITTSKIIDPIIDRMRNKKYVYINENLDSVIAQILEAYNDSLSRTDNQEENENTYSRVTKENDDLHAKLSDALEKIEQLQADLDSTSLKYIDANAKKEEAEKTIDSISKLIQKRDVDN